MTSNQPVASAGSNAGMRSEAEGIKSNSPTVIGTSPSESVKVNFRLCFQAPRVEGVFALIFGAKRRRRSVVTIASITKMEDAMTNAAITILKRPDIDQAKDIAPKCNTPEVAVVEGTAREQELELVSSRPSGVLKELALARWRGSERATMKTGVPSTVT
jgi:hypothetical protein